jgi:hypothetical protein
MWKRFDKDLEEPIATNIGYPYNILPKGYPNSIRSKKINEVVGKLYLNLLGNAGVESVVSKNTLLINLGLNELAQRDQRLQSRVTLAISLTSLAISLFSLIWSIKPLISS